MESIGRLAGGVAHDFNNLLTVINGHVDLMRLQVLPQDPLREQMEQVAAAGERAARLTRQLLAFSRRQVLQLEPVALNQVVNDLGKMLRRLIGEDVRLETRLEAGLPAVLADAGQLEQVLVNLAVNSRDAMPEGGTLTVSTQSLHVDAEFCRLHRPQPPGHYCLLEVSDTGVGMGADVLSRVFEPFFTTKEKGRGTGLGLATVYGIVKQVDGYIWAESEPGRGTTFQIFFPVVHAAVEPRDPRAAAGLLLKGSETVLVVEDEEMVRRLAVRLLRSHGYQVLEADHGREALAVLEANPEVRLVLSDVIMPVMGGRELALNLQARPRPPALIFMSGYTEEDIARQGLVKAGLHFIQKPFDMTTLLQKVRAVLDGR
jgi:CheY-like chemotaxis protein